ASRIRRPTSSALRQRMASPLPAAATPRSARSTAAPLPGVFSPSPAREDRPRANDPPFPHRTSSGRLIGGLASPGTEESLMESLPIAAVMLGGLDVSAAVILNFSGDFERRVVRYDCGDGGPLTADYIIAAPNYLAVIELEGKKLVFVTVLSASGARYAAGEYEWWTKGGEGTLTNLAAPDS